MNDIDRLECIDSLFSRAATMKATEPAGAALLYAVAAEWLNSLVTPSPEPLEAPPLHD